MSCPSCGKPTQTANCLHCGMNAEVYMKTVARSNAHYNKALALAQDNDLTGAAAHLLRSLVYYKRNVDARNLLGLIYCTTGRVGEGLKQWVISLSFRPKENVADEYMAWFQKNPRKLEALSDSVRMYNQALEYLHQKSEDIAIIRLKKAVDLNPDFLEAQCLLALAYMISRDKTHAMQCVERVLAKDAGNPTAWRYYRELSAGGGRAAQDSRRALAQNSKMSRQASYPLYPSKAKSGLPLSGIIYFVVGAICAFAVAYILFMPQMVTDREKAIDSLNKQLSEAQNALNTQISEKDAEINALTAQVATLTGENDALTKSIAQKETEAAVYAALMLYQQDRLEDALAQLAAVVPSELSAEALEVYTLVNGSARTSLEKKNFDEGYAAYSARRNDDAKAAFELAIKYVAEGSETIDDAYYYLGQLAERVEDHATAVLRYEKVLEFPNSNRLDASQGRLNVLRPLVDSGA